MTIVSDKTGKSTVAMKLSGRLDAANAPMLERKIKQVGDEILELILDFSELNYISSMGLRVLLHAQKAMNEKKGRMVINNMNETVREVFAMAGFLHLMVQEERFVVIRRDTPECIILSLNGEMKTEDVSAIKKELSAIKDKKTDAVCTTVVLDMEAITYISHNALKLLNDAITDTAGDERKLEIRNASVDVQAALQEAALQEVGL